MPTVLVASSLLRVKLNSMPAVTKLKVRNTGDRPVQIGSHFHFFEVNRAIEMDRGSALA